MKRIVKYILFIGCIIFSCFGIVASFYRAFLCQPNIYFSLLNLLKRYFIYYNLYTPPFNYVRVADSITYFSALLFGYFIITISLFGASRKYREMVILRYGTKPKFLAVHCRKGFINSGLVVLVFSISLLVAGYFYNHSLQINNSDILQLLLRFANLFLFYNILVLVNIFCLLFTHDWVSIVA